MNRTPAFVLAAAAAIAGALGCWLWLGSSDAAPAFESDRPDPNRAAEPSIPRRRTFAPRRRTKEQAEREPEAPSGLFVVRVKRIDSRPDVPIAGARVAIRSDSGGPTWEAWTDKAGLARIDTAITEGDLSRVDVSAPGFASQTHFARPGRDAEMLFELWEGVAVHGVVLDVDGRALADVRVRAFLNDGTVPTVAEATTDARGTFQLEGLPARGVSNIQIAARRHVPRMVRWAGPGEGRIEVRLAPAGLLRGVVRDPSGDPAPAATVTASPIDGTDPSDAEAPSSIDVEADAKGRYEIDGLRLGCTWTAFAAKDCFADSTDSAGVVLDAGHPEATCDLALRRLSTIELVVLDPSGVPVTEGRVACDTEAGRRRSDLDREGRATIRVTRPGVCGISVFVRGYLPGRTSAESPQGATTRVTVRLVPGSSITGVVVDDLGHPVEGARLDIGESTEPLVDSDRSCRSGEDGSFRFDGLCEGARRMTVDAKGHGHAVIPEVVPPAGPLRVVLCRDGWVSLRLRAPGEAPLHYQVSFVRLDQQSEHVSRPWTDDEITTSLPAGDWSALVQVSGYLPARREFVLSPGEDRSLGEILLDPGIHLMGRVEDGRGRPIRRATVRRGQEKTETDSTGGFVFEHLTPGTETISVSADGYLDAALRHPLDPGSAPLVVTLPRGGRVRGIVRDAAGAPVGSMLFTVFTHFGLPDCRETEMRTDADGTFCIRVLDGPCRVCATSEADESVSQDVTVREGEETAVDLAFSR